MPTVKDIMSKNVITIDQDKSVFEAADLMAAKGIGCLVITRQDMPVGIVTERDFVRRVVAKRGSFEIKVFGIMSKYLITVSPETSLKEASRVMSKNKIHRLPVLKDGKLVGIVVASDFVRNLGKKTTTEEILDALGRYPANTSIM
jgi:CBS domain-containing protein